MSANYLKQQLVNHIFRTASYTKPTTIAVGLYTAAPSDAGGGTEVSGNGYARVALNPLDANWAAATTNGTTSNSVAINFPSPTGSWGTVTHYGIFDSTTSGNLLFWAALDASVLVSTSGVVSFPAGSLTVTIA